MSLTRGDSNLSDIQAMAASVNGSAFTDEMGSHSDQLFYVTSYSDFEKLGESASE